jgi:hypothetical protein
MWYIHVISSEEIVASTVEAELFFAQTIEATISSEVLLRMY